MLLLEIGGHALLEEFEQDVGKGEDRRVAEKLDQEAFAARPVDRGVERRCGAQDAHGDRLPYPRRGGLREVNPPARR